MTKMKFPPVLALALLVMGAIAVTPTTAMAQTYRVIKIAENAIATDINEDSDVCGYYLNASNPTPGFVFGSYGGSYFMYSGSHRPIAFSPNGYYVAHTQGADLFVRPPSVIFNAGLFDGATIGMRSLPADFTVYDVNDDGVVVGSRPLPGGTLSHTQAFTTSLWNIADTYLNGINVSSPALNSTFAFEFSYATCVNNAGKTGVQGHLPAQSGISSGTCSGISPVNNSTLRSDGTVAYVEDINANNVCSGRYYNNAALFAEQYPGGPLVRTVNITPEGVIGHPSYARGLNDKNEAVGWYTPGSEFRCFIYTGGQTKDLESLLLPERTKWHLVDAWDINNRGDIAAIATYEIKDVLGFIHPSAQCAVLLKKQ